jgi:hypothetical protein
MDAIERTDSDPPWAEELAHVQLKQLTGRPPIETTMGMQVALC